MAITCPACGSANDDDARFCSHCGAGLPQRCPSCGAGLSPGAVFCKACGRPVHGPAEATAPGPDALAEGGGAPVTSAPPGAGSPPYDAQGTGGHGAGMPAGPPPVVPPAPVAAGGGGGRKRLPTWAIVVIIVAGLATAAAVALAVILPSGDGDEHATASPSPVVTATPTGTASASTSPSPSPAASTGFPMAVASGAKANILATVDEDGQVTPLSGTLGPQVEQVLWSPDGRRLACVAGAWGETRLWLADVEGGELVEASITTPAVVAVDSVAWLSSTELVVAGFTVKPGNEGQVAELLVYDVEAQTVSGPLQDGGGASLRGASVSSSADGRRVAYVTYTDQKTNEYGAPTATERLQLLDRDSGTVAVLGTGEAYFDVNARRFDHPLISPDGQAVIYRAAGSDVGTSYTVVDANGSTIMRSKELNFPAGYAWDPTGQKVVFTGHSINGGGGAADPVAFYVYDRTRGGKPRTLVKYKGTMVQELSWSPDGASIAFAEYDRDHYDTGNVYQLSATGGDAHKLLGEALSPAYRPAAGGS